MSFMQLQLVVDMQINKIVEATDSRWLFTCRTTRGNEASTGDLRWCCSRIRRRHDHILRSPENVKINTEMYSESAFNNSPELA